jgi:hypothetical protein
MEASDLLETVVPTYRNTLARTEGGRDHDKEEFNKLQKFPALVPFKLDIKK